MRKWISNSQELTRMIETSSEFKAEDASDKQFLMRKSAVLIQRKETNIVTRF